MICLDYRHAKLWCCEDISKIENYDKAIADKTQTWVCHHKDIPRSGSRWVKYGMTRNAIMKKLHLGRKQVEQLDKDNKLIEVINELD